MNDTTLTHFQKRLLRINDTNVPNMQLEKPNLTRAAVLVPLVWRAGSLKLILTKRTMHLPTHAGEIAFPGGKMERDDRDILHTALRETFEEIGLEQRNIKPLGAGDNYQTGTNFLITPIVAMIDSDAKFSQNTNEVAEIFELDFEHLFDVRNHQSRSAIWKGKLRQYYVIESEGREVWGVTAAIINSISLRLAENGGK
jgi:8-oxo-dGTP pyrophosphatase MutT (NUDIX family)